VPCAKHKAHPAYRCPVCEAEPPVDPASLDEWQRTKDQLATRDYRRTARADSLTTDVSVARERADQEAKS
jgi:hypothetical protein